MTFRLPPRPRQVGVMLTVDERRRLEQLAAAEGVSLSWIGRRAFRREMARTEAAAAQTHAPHGEDADGGAR